MNKALRDLMIFADKTSCYKVKVMKELMKRINPREYGFTGNEILTTINGDETVLTYQDKILDCDSLIKLNLEIKFFLRNDKKTDIEINLTMCEVGNLIEAKLYKDDRTVKLVEEFLDIVLERLEDHFGRIETKTIRDIKKQCCCVIITQGITISDTYHHAFFRFQEDVLKALKEGNTNEVDITLLHLKKIIFDRLRMDSDVIGGEKQLIRKLAKLKKEITETDREN